MNFQRFRCTSKSRSKCYCRCPGQDGTIMEGSWLKLYWSFIYGRLNLLIFRKTGFDNLEFCFFKWNYSNAIPNASLFLLFFLSVQTSLFLYLFHFTLNSSQIILLLVKLHTQSPVSIAELTRTCIVICRTRGLNLKDSTYLP